MARRQSWRVAERTRQAAALSVVEPGERRESDRVVLPAAGRSRPARAARPLGLVGRAAPRTAADLGRPAFRARAGHLPARTPVPAALETRAAVQMREPALVTRVVPPTAAIPCCRLRRRSGAGSGRVNSARCGDRTEPSVRRGLRLRSEAVRFASKTRAMSSSAPAPFTPTTTDRRSSKWE